MNSWWLLEEEHSLGECLPRSATAYYSQHSVVCPLSDLQTQSHYVSWNSKKGEDSKLSLSSFAFVFRANPKRRWVSLSFACSSVLFSFLSLEGIYKRTRATCLTLRARTPTATAVSSFADLLRANFCTWQSEFSLNYSPILFAPWHFLFTSYFFPLLPPTPFKSFYPKTGLSLSVQSLSPLIFFLTTVFWPNFIFHFYKQNFPLTTNRTLNLQRKWPSSTTYPWTCRRSCATQQMLSSHLARASSPLMKVPVSFLGFGFIG